MSLLDDFHGQRFLTLEENDPLVKQGGGGDIPEPTIADAGKVLGVDDEGGWALMQGDEVFTTFNMVEQQTLTWLNVE